jgi:hypothetical protein
VTKAPSSKPPISVRTIFFMESLKPQVSV